MEIHTRTEYPFHCPPPFQPTRSSSINKNCTYKSKQLLFHVAYSCLRHLLSKEKILADTSL